MALSESGFVAAALASWIGLDKRLPDTVQHGVLTYSPESLYDGRRDEQVAKVIRKGKRIAIVYKPRAGQRYGSWGRVSQSVAGMLVDAWRALGHGTPHLFVAAPSLGGTPREIVERMANDGDYAGALALAPFAGVKKRDVPVPKVASVGGMPEWSAAHKKRQASEAAEYLVPELVKARRKREREEREAVRVERERMRREYARMLPYQAALDAARGRLYGLQRGDWSVKTLLAHAKDVLAPADLASINAGDPVFKITYADGTPCSGGNGADRWPLPGGDGKPGDWTQDRDYVRACSSGWHLCTVTGISEWIKPGHKQVLWRAEGAGGRDDSSRKAAFQRARLVKRLVAGDLRTLGKPTPDAAAIEAAQAAVEEAETVYRFAQQGYC